MQVQLSGKHVDVGEALGSRITQELNDGVGKYFERGGQDAEVVVTKDGHLFKVDCWVRLASGQTLYTTGLGGDAHGAFTESLDKLEKRVRRYKRRMVDHHAEQGRIGALTEAAAYAVIEADDEDTDAADSAETGDGAPMIIAETRTDIRTMAVSTAVLQLELGDRPAIMFRNPSTGVLNVVYRRADGNIGWIDPGRSEAGSAGKAA